MIVEETKPRLFDLREVMSAAIASGEVQIQNVTGKRREGPILPRARAREDEGIPLIEATALSVPEPQKYRKLKKDEEFKTLEQRETEETMSTAIAQPHRRGSEDRRLSEPLGRLIAASRLRSDLYDVGEAFAVVVYNARRAQGLGGPPGAPPDDGYPELSDKEIETRNELSIMRRKEAEDMLWRLDRRLPGLMIELCVDQLEQPLYRHQMLIDGLMVLGVAWGMIKIRHGEPTLGAVVDGQRPS